MANLHIHRNKTGAVTHLTIDPPLYKVRGTVFETIPLVFTMTSHENNACQLILTMMEQNPLKPGQDPKKVPLFRFPESAGRLAGQVLHPRLLVRLDRDAIDHIRASKSDAFDAYSSAKSFSGHSYRVGGAVSLLLTQCPRHVIMAAGR